MHATTSLWVRHVSVPKGLCMSLSVSEFEWVCERDEISSPREKMSLLQRSTVMYLLLKALWGET